MKKIINELINGSIRGVDVYRYKSGTWLIFTDEVRWVAELTDDGTLWYNYKFFKDVFNYVSIDVGKEMEEYIIQWANEYFYKDCAFRVSGNKYHPARPYANMTLEEIIEKGVKEVYDSSSTHRQMRAQNLMGRIINEVKPNRVTVHDKKMDRFYYFYYEPACTANNISMDMIIEDGVKG